MNITKEVDSLFENFWRLRLKNSPEFGTFCGVHEYDDKLETYTFDAIKDREKSCKEFLEKAEGLIGHSNINNQHKESLEIFIAELNIYIKGLKYKGFYFPLCYLDGPHLEFTRLIEAMKFETIEDYEKLLSRYRGISIQLAEMMEFLKKGIKEQLVYNIVSVASIPNQIEQLLKGSDTIEDTVFYKPFKHVPDSISDERRQSILSEAKNLISKTVIPAFKSLQEFINLEYIPKVRPQPEISSVPGGLDFYQSCLDFHLECHLTPKEIHETGLAEVARITKELQQVIKHLGFENMSVKDFSEKLRTGDFSEAFYFQNGEELLNAYKALVYEVIQPKLKSLFKDIPDAKVQIEPFPPAMSEGPMAYYLAGTPDGSRPGIFYVNDRDVKSSPKYQMMALALHEAVPGHHLQQSYLFETKGLPAFRQFLEDRKYSEVPSRFPLHTAYIEGWGLYSEYLGNELGLYEDTYDYFGYLSQEIFRAARLVVDTGIHVYKWPIEKAVDYMLEHTASSRREIENEVKRYVTWPGQACAYKIGELKIKALRAMAEKELGAEFNIQDFHSIVLKCCGPLDVLEKKVQEYINSNQN